MNLPHHLLDPALFADPEKCCRCGVQMFAGITPNRFCNDCRPVAAKNTTDHEDLALAAKAAGKQRCEWDHAWLAARGEALARDMLWDPRRDSGQALELLADMGEDMWIETGWCYVGDSEMDRRGKARALITDDQAAAMRLAIFRAAVAIGRAMP